MAVKMQSRMPGSCARREAGPGGVFGARTEELGWGLGREQWESHRSGGFVAVPNTTGGASSGMQR